MEAPKVNRDTDMKANYDFSKAVKNPYAKKMKEGYSVLIHYGLAKEEQDGAEATTPSVEEAPA